MLYNKKSQHIVFQVLNFLHNSISKTYKLLPIDKLILITLASHKGSKGIFPMQETLADELETSRRYMRSRLKFLEKSGLIFVEKMALKNHYHLTFISPLEDPQIPQEEKLEDLQIPLKRIYRSPNRGSTDATNNKLNNKIKNRERARAIRAPLSDSWKPNKKNQEKALDVARKVGRTSEELLTKFRNVQKSKNGTSADWNAEFNNFLINERPTGFSILQAQPAEVRRSTGIDFTAARLEREAKGGKSEFERKRREEMDVYIPTPKEALEIIRKQKQGELDARKGNAIRDKDERRTNRREN